MKGLDDYAAKQKTVQLTFFPTVKTVGQFAPFVLASQLVVASQHTSQFVPPQPAASAASFRLQQRTFRRGILLRNGTRQSAFP